jgi:hypothetical protein
MTPLHAIYQSPPAIVITVGASAASPDSNKRCVTLPIAGTGETKEPPEIICNGIWDIYGNTFVGQSMDVKPAIVEGSGAPTVSGRIDAKEGDVRETIPPVEEPLNGDLSGKIAHCAPEWLTKDQFEIRCTDSNGQLLIISGPYWGTLSTKHKRK